MKIQLVNYSMASEVLEVDYAWLTFKSYFEDNNNCKTQWEWLEPITESFALGIEDLVSDIVNRSPDVVGFSLYVWNVGLSLAVAKLVKERIPHCKTIIGGPHITYKEDLDYFKTNYFIDAVCKEDGYGEVFITEYLHQLEQTTPNLDAVPYCVYPSQGRALWRQSTADFYKRSFVWPKDIYQRNTQYIDGRISTSKQTGRKIYIAYETSRGCPFGCTYCEWGGGINSKVTFKPTDDIISDIHFIMSRIKPYFFSFTDANFGIIDRDVDIIKYICSWKEKLDVPSVMYFFGPSKVNKQNVYQIEALTAQYKMLSDYKVPVQDLNRDVLINIDRTDEDWKLQLEEYIKIREKHGGKIRLEMILGLPGATLDSYFEALDYACNIDVFGRRYLWHLLPTTPASDSKYRDKFKIKTLLTRYGMRSTIDGGPTIIRKGFVETDAGKNHLVVDPRWLVPTEIVIETSSYTKDDWTTMYLMDYFLIQSEVGGFLNLLTKYMSDNGVPHSQFYKMLWDTFLYGPNKLTPAQNNLLQTLRKEVNEKLIQPQVTDFEYFGTPVNYPFQVICLPGAYFNIIVNTNVSAFYGALKDWCNLNFGEDSVRDDLIVYLGNMVKTISYTPGEYKFKSNYDWSNYGETRTLQPFPTTYQPYDEVPWSGQDLNIRIHKHFLTLCSNSLKSRLFEHVKVMHD